MGLLLSAYRIVAMSELEFWCPPIYVIFQLSKLPTTGIQESSPRRVCFHAPMQQHGANCPCSLPSNHFGKSNRRLGEEGFPKSDRKRCLSCHNPLWIDIHHGRTLHLHPRPARLDAIDGNRLCRRLQLELPFQRFHFSFQRLNLPIGPRQFALQGGDVVRDEPEAHQQSGEHQD